MTAPTLLPPSNIPCDCEGYDAPGCVSCKGCYSCLDASGNVDISCNIFHKTQRMDQTQKRIQGVVRAPSSLFTMNLAAFNVFEAGGAPYPTTTQTQSDRRKRHTVPITMGTYRGSNSTKHTKTSLRPGATNAPGTGVDVKHGSYARYLAKKKGTGPLRGQASANFRCQNDPRVPNYQTIRENPHITTGGKNAKFGMIAACYCPCSS